MPAAASSARRTSRRWPRGGPAARPRPRSRSCPSRVVLQDFTGVPAVVDLAAMRDAMAALGRRPGARQPARAGRPRHRPLGPGRPVGRRRAFAFNVGGVRAQRRALPAPALGADRVPRPAGRAAGNRHRPPGQPRVPRDGRRDRADEDGRVAFPDTLVGTDSHTTMINGLGVLGYGVGGIEAEAVLLGQPLYQPMPRIVGVRLHGELPRGSTATDLVLVVTEMLRAFGVVGAFVEFAGDGLAGLSLADRATIANMSPEFGATSTLFPIDDETLAYLRLTGRPPERVDLVERYAQGAGPVARAGRGPGLRRAARARPRHGRAVARGAAPAPGPGRAPEACARTSGRLPGRLTVGVREAAQVDRRGRQLAQSGMTDEARLTSAPPATTAERRRSSRRPAATSARLGRDRGDHVMHEHVQPDGHGRCRAPRAEGGRARADGLADREDVARAGLQGRHRLPRDGRAHGPARGARVRARRLRLHDLHRQLRPARRADRDGDRGRRPRRRGRALRATATSRAGSTRSSGRAISPRRRWSSRSRSPAGSTSTSTTEPLGTGSDGRPVMLADIWPTPDEIRSVIGDSIDPRCSADLLVGVRGRRPVAGAADPGGRPLRLGSRSTYIANPPFFDGLTRRPPAPRHRGRARPRGPRRFGHDRPHQPGRLDRPVVARRPVAPGARRRPRSTSTRTAPGAGTTRS